MARQTHLREREVARVDRLWRPGESEDPLLVSFYLTEIEGCVRCVGYAVRTFLAVAKTDDRFNRYEVSVPLPRSRSDDPAEDSHEHDALRANGELPALLIHADKELGEPFPVNATTARALPFGYLLNLATREYAAHARHADEALAALSGGTVAVDRPDGQEVEVHFGSMSLAQRELAAAADIEAAPRARKRRAASDRPPLDEVAKRYVAACRSGSNSPTRDVADYFRRSPSTVAKWIMRCRKAGLLGPTRQGHAGGLVDSEGGTP